MERRFGLRKRVFPCVFSISPPFRDDICQSEVVRFPFLCLPRRGVQQAGKGSQSVLIRSSVGLSPKENGANGFQIT